MRKKERKGKNKGYKFCGILLMIASALLVAIVLYINILPLKYLVLFLGIIIFLNLISDFFLFRKRIKKKPRKFFAFLALLLSVIFTIGSFFIFKTFGLINDMNQDYKIYTYNVLVKQDSSYEKISDISGKVLGYYNDNKPNTKKALSTLSEKVSTENESFGNLESLGNGLLKSESDAIVIEESQNKKMNDAGKTTSGLLSDFENKTRVIYTFKVKVKEKKDEVNVTKDVFNIYVSGMDEYGKVTEKSRSDVNMIVTVNPKTKQVLLTNIPRDYYVQIHETSGYKDKLTHAGIYGVETSEATLEDLLGIKINYYVKVNFSSLVNIIDALGGVDVYSEYDFQSWNGYNFSKGYNRVDGKAGLSFVRERKTFNTGDNQRGKNQQAMIEAILRKCMSPSIITKYNGLLNSLEDSMITNMPTKSITKLAKMQLKKNSKWTITSNSLTGTGSSEYTYTYPGQALYVTVPDEESLKLSKELIAKVTAGDILESSYSEDSSNVHSVTKSSVSKSTSWSTKKKTSTPTKTKEEVKKAEVNPVAEDTKTNSGNTNSDATNNNANSTSGESTSGDTGGSGSTGGETGGSSTGGETGGNGNTGGEAGGSTSSENTSGAIAG